jgi:hypothetical protein
MTATTKELNKRIDALAKLNSKVTLEIRDLGIDCLEHLDLHGDTMPLNRLVLALSRPQIKPFIEWALAFGKVSKNNHALTKATQPLAFDKGRKTDIEGARAKPWDEFADDLKASTAKAFDLQAAVFSLLKKAGAAGTDHETLVKLGAVAGIPAEKVPATITKPTVTPQEAIV